MNKTTFTETEASTYIGMSRSFLRQDRMNGVRENRTPGPKFLKIGRSVRYLKEDLDIWLAQHRVNRSE
jgi:predicted DNA-binding transcriptional regulator AlpA